jgi:hypothetical protein
LLFDVFTKLRVDSAVVDPQRNRLLARRKLRPPKVLTPNFPVAVVGTGISILASRLSTSWDAKFVSQSNKLQRQQLLRLGMMISGMP